MVNYQNTKIYRINCMVSNDFYVGYTTKRYLCQRMTVHRACAHGGNGSKLYECMNRLGVDNFKIELIETYPCMCKDEALARESYWMRELGANLNDVIDRKLSAEHIRKREETRRLRHPPKGTVYYINTTRTYVFSWRDGDKQRYKSYSVKKHPNAKELAEAAQARYIALRANLGADARGEA